MSCGCKKLGVFLGVLAVIAFFGAAYVIMCPACDNDLQSSLGLFFIGMGFFGGSVVNLLSTCGSGSTASVSKPAKTAKSGKPASAVKGKSPAKPKPDQDNKVAIYAGNLSPEATEEDVRRAFEPFGTITLINVVMDRPSGKCKGFAFVEMPVKKEAIAAIDALNGHELAGRKLKISVARSMPRPGRSSGPRRRPRPSSSQSQS